MLIKLVNKYLFLLETLTMVSTIKAIKIKFCFVASRAYRNGISNLISFGRNIFKHPMEPNTFQVLQYLWGTGKIKTPHACRSSPRGTMKKFKSQQKRNTRNSSLMPRPRKCWNLCCCLQCCGFDPPGNTCLQPQRFVFPFRKSSASFVHHCLAPASAISFVGLSSCCSSSSPVCFSNESCLDEAIPGARQSNCSSFLKKKPEGKK